MSTDIKFAITGVPTTPSSNGDYFFPFVTSHRYDCWY